MRLAVYNVENLFDRPKAMNLGTCPLRQTSCRLPIHADDPRRSDTT